MAFRTDTRGLREFLLRATELRLTGADGQPLTPSSVVDHEQALSVYFEDPYGHLLEVTTYDHEAASAVAR